MSERFEWVPDVARGEWLRPTEAEPGDSILSVVPRGFAAYARLFHPVGRDRPRATRTWNGLDRSTYFEGIDDIEAALETERATWAQAAATFNTTMHAEAQYASLLRRNYGCCDDGAIAADGWRYGDTSEGNLDPMSLAAASAVLARHTATPNAGIAAVWEGWGGLVSSAGVVFFGPGSRDGMPARYSDEMMVDTFDQSLGERLVAAVRRKIFGVRSMLKTHPWLGRHEAEPGSGVLAREVAAGPRLELQGSAPRSYVLFEAGANDFADAAWPDSAPWVDDVMWPESPSILWPDDHSWVLATEIDFDSTVVAGTAALIHELEQTPGLEVLPIGTDADLSRDGDTVNRLD